MNIADCGVLGKQQTKRWELLQLWHTTTVDQSHQRETETDEDQDTTGTSDGCC